MVMRVLIPKATAIRCDCPRTALRLPFNTMYTRLGLNPCSTAHAEMESPALWNPVFTTLGDRSFIVMLSSVPNPRYCKQ